ncbi:MAG TPA: hypothetical protein IAB55_03560 [Candidatus Merdivicinus faecavium]|nr:hypothetical protein [Candidatus Merdivicinus faecavium]
MADSLEKKTCCPQKPRVINIGLASFYEALVSQKVKATQLEWRPPVKQSEEIASLLDDLL